MKRYRVGDIIRELPDSSNVYRIIEVNDDDPDPYYVIVGVDGDYQGKIVKNLRYCPNTARDMLFLDAGVAHNTYEKVCPID